MKYCKSNLLRHSNFCEKHRAQVFCHSLNNLSRLFKRKIAEKTGSMG